MKEGDVFHLYDGTSGKPYRLELVLNHPFYSGTYFVEVTWPGATAKATKLMTRTRIQRLVEQGSVPSLDNV